MGGTVGTGSKGCTQTTMFKSGTVYWSSTHKVLINNQEKREKKRWAIVFKSWISFSCPRGSGQLVKKYNIQKHILTQTHTKTSQLLTKKVKTKALQYYYFLFLAEPDKRFHWATVLFEIYFIVVATVEYIKTIIHWHFNKKVYNLVGEKSRTHTLTHTLCVQHNLVQLCNTMWFCYSRGTSGFQQCCKFIIHLRQRLVALTIPISADVTTAFCCVLAPLKLNVCLQLSTAWLINLSNYLLRQTRRACCLCWAVFLTGEHSVRVRAWR